MNKTKTIATITSINSSKEMMKSLINNGVDAIRINMNYSSLDFAKEVILKTNEINEELKTQVAVLIELKGPGIRVNHIANNQDFLRKDDKIRIFMNNILVDCTKFSVDYKDLVKDIKINSIIKVNNGNIELQVLEKNYEYVLCKVLKEGIIKTNDSVNVPNLKINRPFLSEEDKQTILFAHKMNVDFIALSFVNSEDDVLEVDDLLINLGNDHLQIISKIENESAITNIDNIIKMSEGIMIDRNNLGAEIELERIPGIQKKILSKCHQKGKIGIVATEFLLNSSANNYPTKAEISDIANAVLDGADAIMLSGLTTISKYPIETLKILERTIRISENDINYDYMMNQAEIKEANDVSENISYSVVTCSNKLECKAIFAPTMSGNTPKTISKFRPNCPIVAISPNVDVVKSLVLNFGVYPVLINELKSLDATIEASQKIAFQFLDLKEKDKIIITGGYPYKKNKGTNFMKVEEL